MRNAVIVGFVAVIGLPGGLLAAAEREAAAESKAPAEGKAAAEQKSTAESKAAGEPKAKEEPKAKPAAVEVRADHPDGLYKSGEAIRFSVRLVRDGRPVAGKVLKYRIVGDGGLAESGEITTAEQPQVIETRLARPGILTCTVTGTDDQTGKPIRGAWGAGVDVFEITPGMPRPKDFDAFWKEVRAELAAVPIEVLEQKEVPLPKYLHPAAIKGAEKRGVKLYDIKIACPGGRPVSGYLALPGKMEPGTCPASVTFAGAPGYFIGAWVPVSTASAGGIGLGINAHGTKNGKQPAEYYQAFRKEVGPWFPPDRRKVYIRGMALRAMRAMEYLKSLPAWNGKDLTVGGGSMGGGQALLAAALDEDVSFCSASAPTFCDWAGGLQQQRSGWPGGLKDPKKIEAAAYYDLANLCTQIQAPTIIRTGFLDHLCASTGHFAIYNRMTCPKLIFHHPGAGHSAPLLNPKRDRKIINEFRKTQQALLDKRAAEKPAR